MKQLVSAKALLLLSTAATFVACAPANKGTVANTTSAQQSQVINGKIVEANDPIAKVTVGIIGLTLDKEGNQESFGCTGTLIEENVVLTAAHCVPVAPEGGKRAAFIIFSRNMAQENLKKENLRKVADFAVHSKWQKTTEEESTADVALMKFEGTTPKGYELANVLSPDKYSEIPKSPIIVAGFGLIDDATKTPSDDLRRGVIKFLGLFGDSDAVSDQADRNGICSGDSGGPAFIEKNGVYYLFGVASRVSGPTEETICSKYGVHGLVYGYIDFIIDTLKAWKVATPAPAQ